MSLLSILICHTPDRQDFLRRLNAVLDPQLTSEVKVFIDDSRYKKIGTKRNDLLARADGKYVAFIDDDDLISKDYVKQLMQGIKQDVDCCSLKGIITEDGQNPLIFEHSIKYQEYRTTTGGEVRYERYPNHLNCIKASIAKSFHFPEKNHGEDTNWATQIFKSGMIKTEHYIPYVIYHYEYRRNK
jgi:glycosyltransferase involved in cell wall biosynthesis